MGFSAGYCKEAELLFKEVISIPIYASLTNEKQNQVIDELKKVLA
jgi:dTDP-4-amino-4,6-dideoxygalactose transaminase